MPATKLLTLDGGGLLGVGQAAVLEALTPYEQHSTFLAIAGTSVGSINGALVSTGRGDRLVAFFQDYGKDIFDGYWWRHYKPLTPRYADKSLNKLLRSVFPGRFGDLPIPMFVTAADLAGRRLKVFRSFDADDGGMNLWEVIRSAVAAETYFLPWKGMADAGIYANNPAVVGAIGASHVFDLKFSDMGLFSIGTGESPDNGSVGSTRGWTYFHWGAYLISAMLEGAASGMHEYFVSHIGLGKYCRVQFTRDASWHIDDPGVVKTALKAWKPDIEAARARLRNF